MKLPSSPRAVVTGAASGLGRAIAIELGRRRGRVLVCDLHEERGAETVRLVREAGGEAAFARCDVTTLADVEAALAEVQRRFGGVDLVVNNAGVAAGGVVGDVPIADWQWIMGVNLWGAIHGCHVFVPALKAQGSGAILNIASAAGLACMPEMASYNVTKAGVIALSETLYAELAPLGIGVSVVCPGFFQTNLLESFRSPETRQRTLAEAMFRRSKTTADEVARAALEGLEAGKLMTIPQNEAAWIWRAKRLLPAVYHRMVKEHAASFAARVGRSS